MSVEVYLSFALVLLGVDIIVSTTVNRAYHKAWSLVLCLLWPVSLIIIVLCAFILPENEEES